MKEHIKKLTVCAMLTAMSVVVGIFCKTFFTIAPGVRITFENIPVVIAGIFMGPVAGAVVGFTGDLISCLFSKDPFFNPIVSAGAICFGLISGLIPRLIIRKRGYLQIILSSFFAHLVGSAIIKTIGLYVFSGIQWNFLRWRIPLYMLVIIPIEILVLCLLYKNKGFRKLLEKFLVSRKK